MFDFFDAKKNPFMILMNLEEVADKQTEDAAEMDPMQFMQQAFMMQMQLVQTIVRTPFQMMESMMTLAGAGAGGNDKAGSAQAPGTGGFRLGNFDIPVELLQMLMQLDMSPENLEKLQKALDFVFSFMPQHKPEDE